MKSFKNAWGQLPPAWRFALRTVAVAAATYAYAAQSDGSFTMDALLDTVKVAGTYALLGLFTPLEAFVGPAFAKPDTVAVPVPPAVDEDQV